MVSKSDQCIVVNLNPIGGKELLQVCFMYGFHSIEHRKPLWTELRSTVNVCSVEWIAIGDFNSVFESSHRINGREITVQETEYGDHWLTQFGLGFIKSQGHFFF